MATNLDGVTLRAGRPSRLDAYLPGGNVVGTGGTDPASSTTSTASTPYTTQPSGMKRAHSTSALETAAPKAQPRIIRHTRYIRSSSTETAPAPPALLGFICSAESQRRSSASAASRPKRAMCSSAGASAASSTESLNALLMDAAGRNRNRRGSSQESSCSTASVRSVGGRSVKTSIAAAAAAAAPLPRRGAKLTADVRAPWKGESTSKAADHAPHVVASPTLAPIGSGSSRVSMLGTTRVSTGFLDRVATADIPHHLEELERQLGLHSSMSSISTATDVDSLDTTLGIDLDDIDVDDLAGLTPSGSFENLLTEEELSHVTSAIARAPSPRSPKVKVKGSSIPNLDARYERVLLSHPSHPTETTTTSSATTIPTTTSTHPADPGGRSAAEVTPEEAVVTKSSAEVGRVATPGGMLEQQQQQQQEERSELGVRTEAGRMGELEEEEAELAAGISTAGSQPPLTPPPPPPTPTLTPSPSPPPTSHSAPRPPGLLETEINDALEVEETLIEVEVIPEVDMQPRMRDAFTAPSGETPAMHQQIPEVGQGEPDHPSAEGMDSSVVLPHSVLSAYEDYVRPVSSQPAEGERVGDDDGRLMPPETAVVTPPSGEEESSQLPPTRHQLQAAPATVLPTPTSPSAPPGSSLPVSDVQEQEQALAAGSTSTLEEAGSSRSTTPQVTTDTMEQHITTNLDTSTAAPATGTTQAGAAQEETGVAVANTGVINDIPTDTSQTSDPLQGQVRATQVTEKPRLKGILKKTSSYEIKEPEDSERKVTKDIDIGIPIHEIDSVKDSGVSKVDNSETRPISIPASAEVKPLKESHAESSTQKDKTEVKTSKPEVKAAKPEVKTAKPEVAPKLTSEDLTASATLEPQFPTLTDLLSVTSFDPGALTVRMRLTLLDVIINFLLLTPLTVLFYYATCRLLEICLLCVFPRLGAWLLLFVGAAIEFAASFWQRPIIARSPRPAAGRAPFADVNIPFLLASKGYNFVLGIGNVCHMLAMTSLVDLYVGTGFDVSLRVALTSLVVLWTLRCGRNVVAPPLYVGIDADDLGVFTSTTMFKVEPDLSVESSADILGTVGVVMSFVHLHWAGVWNCADAVLFPLSFTLSMLLSLLVGSALCLLFMLLQQSATEISRNLEREKKEPLRLIFENVFVTTANVGVILLWRGLWMVYDLMADYFPIYCRTLDVTPLAACVLSFLLLALAHCSSTVLFKGCEVDGELVNGEGVRFANGYFTEILQDPSEDSGVTNEGSKIPTKSASTSSCKAVQGKSASTITKRTPGEKSSEQSKSPNGTSKTTSTAPVATMLTTKAKDTTSHIKQKNA